MQETGFDPWVRKIPGIRKGNPLQYSCLENSKDRGAWWAIVHGVAESGTQLSIQAPQKMHIIAIQSLDLSSPSTEICQVSLTF